MASYRLRRSLECSLGSGDLDSHGGCGQQASSRGMQGLGMHGPHSTRVSETRLLVGMLQLLLKGNPSTRDETRLGSEVAVDRVASLLVRQVLHGLESRRASDLGAAGEANRNGGSGCVTGWMLALGHAIRLMHRLAARELSVLRQPCAEARLRLVVPSRYDWGLEELFTPLSEQSPGPAVTNRAALNTEEVLSGMHG